MYDPLVAEESAHVLRGSWFPRALLDPGPKPAGLLGTLVSMPQACKPILQQLSNRLWDWGFQQAMVDEINEKKASAAAKVAETDPQARFHLVVAWRVH